jgi:hypothetical protein
MKRIVGIAIGLLYVLLSTLAFVTSRGGWQAGHQDLGFWWGVVGTLLGIAALGAIVGTWIHTRPTEP